MAIPGVVLVSIAMAVYDIMYLYREKSVEDHAIATMVSAFGIPICV